MFASKRIDPALERRQPARQIVREIGAAKHREDLPSRLAVRIRVVQEMTALDEGVHRFGDGFRHNRHIGSIAPIHCIGVGGVVVVPDAQEQVVLAVQVVGVDALVDSHEVDGGLGDVDHVLHLERGEPKRQRRVVEQGVANAPVGHGADVIRQRLARLRGEALDVARHMVCRWDGRRNVGRSSLLGSRVGGVRERVRPSTRLDPRTVFPQPWLLSLNGLSRRERFAAARVGFEQCLDVWWRRGREDGIGGACTGCG